MAGTPRERLARLLDDAEPPDAFSAQFPVPADALHLEVKGAGQIRLPVRAPQARKLCDVARPACFGRGEQTLTDPSVRDTWEIPSDLVTITGPRWAATLEGVLDEVRDQLGLPFSSRLEAELHAMLVYGPGQFFLPHQDSEKDDAMIGTLVVTLPSSHTGGELIVEHGGESIAYRSPKDSLSFVAFYADCRHEVRPVKSGYRVTLTFNLLARSEQCRASGAPARDCAAAREQTVWETAARLPSQTRARRLKARSPSPARHRSSRSQSIWLDATSPARTWRADHPGMRKAGFKLARVTGRAGDPSVSRAPAAVTGRTSSRL